MSKPTLVRATVAVPCKRSACNEVMDVTFTAATRDELRYVCPACRLPQRVNITITHLLLELMPVQGESA